MHTFILYLVFVTNYMIGKYNIPDLLLLLKEGDEKSFAIIYDHYWSKLYYAAYKRLKNQHASEEIVQDVFLTLWRRRRDLEIDCLPSYLATMVRYAVYHYFAKEKAMRDRESRYSTDHLAVEHFADQVNNKLILEKINELSNQLPEKCSLVFKYNKLEDISLKEVADRLNISQKTAEAHLTKALKVVRLNFRGYLLFFL